MMRMTLKTGDPVAEPSVSDLTGLETWQSADGGPVFVIIPASSGSPERYVNLEHVADFWFEDDA